MESILQHCHSREVGGHFGATKTAAKVLQSGFHWPTLFKDAYNFVANCDRCQRVGNISRKNEMPLTNILVIELFDIGVLISWVLSLLLFLINLSWLL